MFKKDKRLTVLKLKFEIFLPSNLLRLSQIQKVYLNANFHRMTLSWNICSDCEWNSYFWHTYFCHIVKTKYNYWLFVLSHLQFLYALSGKQQGYMHSHTHAHTHFQKHRHIVSEYTLLDLAPNMSHKDTSFSPLHPTSLVPMSSSAGLSVHNILKTVSFSLFSLSSYFLCGSPNPTVTLMISEKVSYNIQWYLLGKKKYKEIAELWIIYLYTYTHIHIHIHIHTDIYYMPQSCFPLGKYEVNNQLSITQISLAAKNISKNTQF